MAASLWRALGLAAAASFASAAALAEAPSVVASVKPVHSLAAAVMAGVAAPELLVPGRAAPHGYSLKPSDARRLEAAEVVFWIGPGLESYLAKPLANLAGAAIVVELAAAPGVRLLPPRGQGDWVGEDEAAHDGAGHDEAAWDGHLWLDPRNARATAAAMVETLAARDPANAAAYRANGAALEARLAALDVEIDDLLAPIRERPFVVFHDAYQYIEARYGLAALGAIAVSPDRPPGPRRLADIRDRLARAACVFREPAMDAPLFEAAVAGSPAIVAELDPEGLRLEPGADFYFALMRGLAGALRDCLAPSG